MSIYFELKEVADAAANFYEQNKTKRNLLYARPGYKFLNGQITKEKVIVAVVKRKENLQSLSIVDQIPSKFDNYAVDVVNASPLDLLKFSNLTETGHITKSTMFPESTFLENIKEAGTRELSNGYLPPDNVFLRETTEAMTLLCNVSPEGGWETLGPFLVDTTDHLQVAMYDFSAPQIVDSLKTILDNGASIKLVYDGMPAAHVGTGTKVDDVKEEDTIKKLIRAGKNSFEYVKATKGKDGICNNAYHIKVAVKDKKSFWLSSGNWQTSNQPAIPFNNDNIVSTKDYNREWSIVVDNKALAEIYYKFIDWDFECSSKAESTEAIEKSLFPLMYVSEEAFELKSISKLRLFPPRKFTFTKSNPVKIQPVLSPDNYIEQALKIIKSAKKTLYFQNQYIKIGSPTPEYKELLDTLRDKINEVEDGAIILRSMFSADDRAMLEGLQAHGFDMDRVKLMSNTHTKGIIADGERILIGSHNWSNAGVQFNRDASLLIYDEGVAQYYLDVFLHDWERRTKKQITDESVQLAEEVDESTVIEKNLVAVDWSEYFS